MMDISRLQIQLLNTKLQNKDNPLYQLLNQLIGGLDDTSKEVKALSGVVSGSAANNVINNNYSIRSGSEVGSGLGGLSASSVSHIVPPTSPTLLFTPGSVIFAGSAGELSQDNANFFWDAAKLSLGIGTKAFPATGTGILIFADLAGPGTMGLDTAGIYANSVAGIANMYAVNENGIKIRLTGDATDTLALTVQNNITQLGTISAGIWQGTIVGVTFGGTGSNLSATGGANQVLKQSSAGAAITVGTLAVANLSDGSNVALLNATTNIFTGRVNYATTSIITSSGDFGYNSIFGNYLFPKAGSTNDLTFFDAAGNPAWRMPTGTPNLIAAGTLAWGGGSAISSSTKLSNFVALANAVGVLANDGAGNYSWSAAGSGTITGSGTIGKIAKFTSASAIGDSIITESSGLITITGTSVSTILRVLGADAEGFADVEIKSTGSTGQSRLFFSDTAALSGYIKYNHNANSLIFGTVGADRVTIDNTGLINATAGIKFTANVAFPGAGSISKHTANGLFIAGVTGSVFDFTVTDPTGASGIIMVPTGTLNVNFGGTISATGTIRSTSANGWAIGSIAGVNRLQQTSGEFSFLTSADILAHLNATSLCIGAGQTNPGAGIVRIVGAEATSAYIQLWADEGDDVTDKWDIIGTVDGTLRFRNNGNERFAMSDGGNWLRNLALMDSVGTPTIASGFAAGSIAGLDYAFVVTNGGVSAGGVVNFANTFSNAPICVGSTNTNTYNLAITAVSTTQVTIAVFKVDGAGTPGIGFKYYIHCRGY